MHMLLQENIQKNIFRQIQAGCPLPENDLLKEIKRLRIKYFYL